LNFVIPAEDLLSFEDNNSVYFSSSERRLREDTIDPCYLESSDNEFYAEHKDSGQGWRNGNEDEVYVQEEHFEIGSVGPYDANIAEVDEGGYDDEDIDKDYSFFKEAFFLLVLIADGPQKLAPEGIEIGMGDETDQLICRVDALVPDD
jgi:hypothetical protein